MSFTKEILYRSLFIEIMGEGILNDQGMYNRILNVLLDAVTLKMFLR